MIIDNGKTGDVVIVSDGEGEGKKMSLSRNVKAEAHILKILTEQSYQKKIESTIRETVSNAIDSMIMAGKGDEGVHVRLKREGYRNWYFECEDTGLGMNLEEFDKYIMEVGNSTKQDNPFVLGYYGAGGKAPLCKVNSFLWTIRKDGVERKILVYKTEDFPDRDVLEENPTELPNGVIVRIDVPAGDDMYQWKNAMKEQLSYLPNIVYEVDESYSTDWNKYKIFRSEDFEWSEMNQHNYLHISLKGIFYPIDWTAMGMNAITVPVALKFGLSDGVYPIFSREAIQYDEDTKRIIKEKIVKVAQWFADRYNSEVREFESIIDALPYIGERYKYVVLERKKFTINSLLEAADVKVNEVSVKGISLLQPSFYKDKLTDLCSDYRPVCYLNEKGNWAKRVPSCAASSLKVGYTVVILKEPPFGKFKQFLMKEYYSETLFVVKKKEGRPLGWKELLARKMSGYYNSYCDILELKDKPKSKWRDLIKEWQGVEASVAAKFEDGTSLESSDEYKEWLEEREKRMKEARVRGESKYKAVNKQKGDVTLAYGRETNAKGKEGVVFEKAAYPVEQLRLQPFLTVYLSEEDKVKYAELFYVKGIKVAVVGTKDREKLKAIHNFKSLKEFCMSRPFSRAVTAMKISRCLDIVPENDELIYEAFPKYKELYDKLEKYKVDNLTALRDGELRDDMLKVAEENNLWDGNIYPELLEFKKVIETFGFLGVLKGNEYLANEEKVKIRKNLIYSIVVLQKKVGCKLEEMELVPKKKPVPVEEDEGYDFYQPKIDLAGFVEGHEEENISSFEVWKYKTNLLALYPNCTPLGCTYDDIPNPIFVDVEPEEQETEELEEEVA